MAASHLLRLGKIKGKNGILNALKHNKRTLQAERGAGANIDTFRTPFNYSLTDPATAELIDRYAKLKFHRFDLNFTFSLKQPYAIKHR